MAHRQYVRGGRATFAGVFVLVALASVLGCQGGHEGDRCNPVLVAVGEDECNKGLVCQQPGACPESYCCPADGGPSNNPFCNGAASVCPAPTGAAADSALTDAGTSD
jgi:hypothetical protein